MIVLQRPLLAKYSGPDEYMPEEMKRDKFLPVVGVKTRLNERVVNGQEKKIEDIYYLLINDKGKLIEVSSFNCTTEINRKLEFNPEQVVQILGAISTVLGTIADQYAASQSGQ